MSAPFSVHVPWSDSEVIALLQLIDDGRSYGRASVLLRKQGFPPRTRNACIGLVWRIKQHEAMAA